MLKIGITNKIINPLKLQSLLLYYSVLFLFFFSFLFFVASIFHRLQQIRKLNEPSTLQQIMEFLLKYYGVRFRTHWAQLRPIHNGSIQTLTTFIRWYQIRGILTHTYGALYLSLPALGKFQRNEKARSKLYAYLSMCGAEIIRVEVSLRYWLLSELNVMVCFGSNDPVSGFHQLLNRKIIPILLDNSYFVSLFCFDAPSQRKNDFGFYFNMKRHRVWRLGAGYAFHLRKIHHIITAYEYGIIQNFQFRCKREMSVRACERTSVFMVGARFYMFGFGCWNAYDYRNGIPRGKYIFIWLPFAEWHKDEAMGYDRAKMEKRTPRNGLQQINIGVHPLHIRSMDGAVLLCINVYKWGNQAVETKQSLLSLVTTR